MWYSNKIFPVSKFGCGEPISSLTSMLQCMKAALHTLINRHTITRVHHWTWSGVTGKLLWFEGSGKLFAHVLNENLSTLVFKNSVLTKVWHHLRKSFVKLLLQISWKLLPLPFTNVVICSSQFRRPSVNFF
jgi:hypothetical protein